MIIGIPRETAQGERRVAAVPETVGLLRKAGLEIAVEPGAGTEAGFPDAACDQPGASLRADAIAAADIVLKVAPPSPEETNRFREGATLIGFLAPYANAAGLQALAARSVTAFAMERMPRITRAQSMDALSAMSTIAGYRAA